MSPFRTAVFALVAGSAALLPTVAAVEAAEPAASDSLPVLAKQEVTLKSRTNDPDVQSKDLYYTRHDGKGWGAWQKHGLSFGSDAPVVWAAPEGRWRTYVRVTEVSGLAMPEPGPDAAPVTEFIIDRTAPVVSVIYPTTRAKLRGGQKVAIRWSLSEPNLAPAPITIRWSRNGDGKSEVVAEKLPNTGSYEWTLPRDMTPNGLLSVVAVDRAGNSGSGDVAQVLVDSIAPTARIVGPAISAVPAVDLAINANDAGPAGLASVQLWISQDNGQTWSEGPVSEPPFKNIAWKTQGDGRYRLALVSADQAGNPSPTPKGKGDDQFILLVDSQKPVIILPAVNGVSLSEAPSKRTKFKPGDRVQVVFDVKDVYLAENPVNVYMQTAADKPWEELGKGLPADSAFRFTIPAKPTRAGRIKVTAIDAAGNLGEAISAEPFVIDTEVEAGDSGLEP